MDRFWLREAAPGTSWKCLSCSVAMAPSGQLQKHVPKGVRILYRFPGER